MTNPRRNGRCIYCGADKDLTVDHVPPKLLLMRPYPPNLITVPACQACNQSFQKDDEYTRAMLAIDVRASKNTAAQSNLPAVLRSLQRPNAKAFAEFLTGQAESSVILGQDGSPMGQVFELDKARVNRTGERFIRAIYFHEMGAALPHNAVVRVECNMGLRPGDAEFKEICRVLSAFRERRHGYVGTAFGYLVTLEPEYSAWLMQLYDFFVWLGTVDFRGWKEPSPGRC
jgi:hypothetical protein